MSDLQYDQRTSLVEPGDHDRFAHIVPGKDGRPGRDVVLEAMINGTPVTALCGHRWIPSRDPERFPLCPTCKEIARELGAVW